MWEIQGTPTNGLRSDQRDFLFGRDIAARLPLLEARATIAHLPRKDGFAPAPRFPPRRGAYSVARSKPCSDLTFFFFPPAQFLIIPSVLKSTPFLAFLPASLLVSFLNNVPFSSLFLCSFRSPSLFPLKRSYPGFPYPDGAFRFYLHWKPLLPQDLTLNFAFSFVQSFSKFSKVSSSKHFSVIDHAHI